MMKNPYENPVIGDQVVAGKLATRVSLGLFVLFLAAVGITTSVDTLTRPEPFVAGESLRQTLRTVENRYDDASLFTRWRRQDQARFVRWFREGNQRVVIGENGTLFYRPDIETVVGKGPYYEEPPSVTRDPEARPWEPVLPAIKHFAAQLAEREIRLVLVPVPTKAMVEAGKLGGADEIVHPKDWDGVFGELEEAGIQMVDLSGSSGTYLKQDTHWGEETMRRAAEVVSEQVDGESQGQGVRQEAEVVSEAEGAGQRAEVVGDRVQKAKELNRYQQNGSDEVESEKVTRASMGDLVGMLSLPAETALFAHETVELTRVLDPMTGEPLANDPESPIVLLGDSFANLYEDPQLGFGVDGETTIGAGFPSHLAAALGQSIHTIAINGGGASDVRERFAALPDDIVRSKETVIWLLSARDLFLAELPARRAGIEWRMVSFNPESVVPDPETQPQPDSSTAPLILTGTVRERSNIPDPATTPYDAAVYSVVLDELEVEQGNYEGEAIYVFLWAFRERTMEASARYAVGERVRLELQPFAGDGSETRAVQLDDLFRLELEERWFGE